MIEINECSSIESKSSLFEEKDEMDLFVILVGKFFLFCFVFFFGGRGNGKEEGKDYEKRKTICV